MLPLAVFLAVIPCSYGYKTFQGLIPNGDIVPHPCGNNDIWDGVGHFNPYGSGPRNKFGVDFIKAGKKWTKDLCRKDSDSDGRTNGEELGDPKCEWGPGKTPENPASSHPGVCEPIDNEKCMKLNSGLHHYLKCEQAQQKPCPALTESGVKSQTMRFPESKVKSRVTTYMCQAYDLPLDGDFHLVATTPNVNNSAIVHHMILFGCDFPDNFSQTILTGMKARPYECGMTPHKHCQQFLATWTYGFHGECMAPNTGFRIGRYGTKIAALQIHWHNPNELQDETDSSGMTIYYKPVSKSSFDASTFLVGQEYLLIPPKQASTTFTATCPSECTSEMWTEKIFVTRAVNHMHYYGRKQRISILRNGQWIRDLTNDVHYDYDSPLFYRYDPPVELLPGDEIVTECTYASDNESTIKFGAGTQDEMCFGFITYYPRQNFLPTICFQWKSIQRCVRKLPKFGGMYNGCQWRRFADWWPNSPTTRAFRNESCGEYRYTKLCNEKCVEDAKELLKHPCLRGDLAEWLEFKAGVPVSALRKCAAVTTYTAKNANRAESIFKLGISSSLSHIVLFIYVLLSGL